MSRKPEGIPSVIPHYIDGERVESVSGETFDVLDPVTNEAYTKAASGDKADIDKAVAAANRVFHEGPWPRMKSRARAKVLNRIADIVESRQDELAAMESFDSGLPITQARGQAQRAAENFRFFADLIVAQRDDTYKVPGMQMNYVNRKPKGVAGLITPWNTPFMLESWKLGPSLASGCTVVLPLESPELLADFFEPFLLAAPRTGTAPEADERSAEPSDRDRPTGSLGGEAPAAATLAVNDQLN